MAEYLTPNVYVEEVESGEVAVPGVSAANAAFCGFSPRGAVNTATLVTSWPQYVREWGGFTALSNVAQHIFAFFQNGGVRAYFSRQVGATAVKASGFLENLVEEEVVGTGNGILVAFGSTLGNFPVRQVVAGGSISITYRIDGAPVAAQPSDLSPTPNGVLVNFTGKLGLLGVDTPIVPGTVVITDVTALAGEVYDDSAAADGILYDAAAAARGFIDYETGHFSLSVDVGAIPDLAASVTYAYTPKIAGNTITDDGAGVLNEAGVGAVGAIAYGTGVWTVAGLSAAPSLGEPLLATYTQDNVEFELLWEGLGGNNIRLAVSGDPNFYTRSTGTYTRAVLKVYERNYALQYVLTETFEGLTFATVTDPKYLLTVVNNASKGSKLVLLSTPTDLELPQSLNSLSRSRAVSAGNGVAVQFGSSGATPTIADPFVTDPLEFPIQPTSVSITYVDVAGDTKTITDDGAGNLTGDVDPAAAVGFNVIDYDTGEFAFQALAVPGNYTQAGNTLIDIAYRLTPTDTVVTDDAAGGTNGVLPLTRTELTNPTGLKADREGVFAFLKIEENLNVVIPEAAGDVDMLGDLTDEAELNGRWFIIAATGSGLTPQEAQEWRRFTYGYTGNRAALYYPWIITTDPITNLPTAMPPMGHIAGIYARTVALKNIGGIPAGIPRATLAWLTGLERKLEEAEIGVLDPFQVNCLWHSDNVNKVVWGANTLESPPADFKYVHSRLLVDYIKLAIYRGAFPFVFEDTGPSLWTRVRSYANNYLLQKYRQDYFSGATPKKAFFVTCDATSNPDPDSEYVYCDLGVRSKKVAKFIVFRVQLRTGD